MVSIKKLNCVLSNRSTANEFVKISSANGWPHRLLPMRASRFVLNVVRSNGSVTFHFFIHVYWLRTLYVLLSIMCWAVVLQMWTRLAVRCERVFVCAEWKPHTQIISKIDGPTNHWCAASIAIYWKCHTIFAELPNRWLLCVPCVLCVISCTIARHLSDILEFSYVLRCDRYEHCTEYRQHVYGEYE